MKAICLRAPKDIIIKEMVGQSHDFDFEPITGNTFEEKKDQLNYLTQRELLTLARALGSPVDESWGKSKIVDKLIGGPSGLKWQSFPNFISENPIFLIDEVIITKVKIKTKSKFICVT